MPESYSYIGDLSDTLKETDQTADYIRNKIKLAEMKNQGEYGEKSTNAFTAKKKEGCFIWKIWTFLPSVSRWRLSGTAIRHMARPDTWSRPSQRRNGATAAEGAATSASM